MQVTGRIKLIGQVNQVSDSFKKRDLVVTTEDQYPQHILIQFSQDKCELLNSFQIGQQVEVGINLRGREWTNPQGEVKHFNSIEGWKINAKGQGVGQTNSAQSFQQQQQQGFTQQPSGFQKPSQNNGGNFQGNDTLQF